MIIDDILSSAFRKVLGADPLHDDMLTAVPHIPVPERPAPNPEAARIAVEDAIAGISRADLPHVLVRALLKAHRPIEVEAIGDRISLLAAKEGRK